jgi:hypothetical protein
MFDMGSGGADVGTHDSGDEGVPERRQYTLKGVEADVIRLMRNAASKEGMKIGSWVSLRMREAAEKALAERRSGPETDQGPGRSQAVDVELDDNVRGALELVLSREQAIEQRFVAIERELHEITSSQRSILSVLLRDRQSR